MESRDNIFLSEYDLKQLRLIEKKIELFSSDKIDLFELISDLTGLLNALENVKESWKNQIQTEINTLEIVYDNRADGSINWKENPDEVINDSIFSIKKLTYEIIDKYLKKSDPSILEIATIIDDSWLMCPLCTEAWESRSKDAMIICPACDRALHNARHLNS